MMSVIALSAPEMLILRKVLKWPLIATFADVVAAGIFLVGYLFNIQDIMGYGIMSTPGVVIDGEVVHAGGVPDRNKVAGWLAPSA